MADQYWMTPEEQVQQQGLARRQAMAQAMMQQAMAPDPSASGALPAGQMFVPKASILSPVAKMVQAWAANKMQQDAEQKQLDLARQHQADRKAEMASILQSFQGREAIPAPSDEAGGGPGRPAIPGSIEAGARAMMASNDPAMQGYGMKLLTEQYKAEQDRQTMAQAIEAARASGGAGGLPSAAIPFLAMNNPTGMTMATLLSKQAETAAGREDTQAARAEENKQRAADRMAQIRATAQLRPEPAPALTTVMKDGKAVVLDARTGRVVGDAPPSKGGGGASRTALQEEKFQKQIAGDFKNVGAVQQNMQEIVNAASAVMGSKGLGAREGYTGYVPAPLQGTEAMKAQNRIDTLKGKVTQMGKAMASMAGAIGPMAVQEWKIVADAVNAIDPVAGNVQEQLQNVVAQAQGAAQRIQDVYERQYADEFEKYPQFGAGNIKLYPSSAPIPGAAAPTEAPAAKGDRLTPAEQSELEALRKRFGK